MLFEDKSKIKEYMLPGEKVVGQYGIGGFDVLTTNANTYFHKSFPMLLKRVPFRDVSSVEYVTHIEWVEVEKAIVYFNVVVLLYLNHNGMALASALLNLLMPQAADTMPAVIIVITLASLLFVTSLTAAAKFIISFRGRFIISKKSGQQVVLYTPMNQELKAFMKEIEVHIDENALGTATQPAQAIAGAKQAYVAPQRIVRGLNRLDEIEGKNSVLVSVDSNRHSELMSEMLDVLINKKGAGGIYVALTRPADHIISTMRQAGVSDENIRFIDCVSSIVGGEKRGGKNVTYIENPNALEEISMHIDKGLSEVKSPVKFMLLDSVSGFLIYSSMKSTKEFLHYFINKGKIDELTCIIINIEGEDSNKLVQDLIPLCDLRLEYK